MELRDLYILSETIVEKVDKKEISSDILNKVEIKVLLTPTIFYGVDKELYFMTHENSYKGFVHSNIVNVSINGVKFSISPEEEKKEEQEH